MLGLGEKVSSYSYSYVSEVIHMQKKGKNGLHDVFPDTLICLYVVTIFARD